MDFYNRENNVELKISALNIISNNAKYFKDEVENFLNQAQKNASDQKIKDAVRDLKLTH